MIWYMKQALIRLRIGNEVFSFYFLYTYLKPKIKTVKRIEGLDNTICIEELNRWNDLLWVYYSNSYLWFSLDKINWNI